MTGQLTLSSSRARAVVPVQDIQAGDFTHVTGYRRVKRVQLHPRKRTVRLYWLTEARTFRYDETLKVSRP